MSALESLDGKAHGNVFLVAFSLLVVKRSGDVHAAGATYDELALLFGVEVKEYFAFQFAGRQTISTIHSGLLVSGYKSLNGTVLQVGCLHYGHYRGHSEAVVSAESGALCLYPITVNVSLYGVCLKIVRAVFLLLRHHIHVSLEDYGLAVFHTRSGRLSHNDVAGLVREGFNAYLLGEVEQELPYFVEMS